MKNLKFHSVKARNIFCFGEEGFDFDFRDVKNIVLVNGQNLDDDPSGKASNGAGKSNWIESVVLALYGKPIKSPTKLGQKDIINNQTKKRGEVELEFDDIRIERTFNPQSVKIFQSKDRIWDKKSDITPAKLSDANKLIEKKVGINYESFINLVYFNSKKDSFLEADKPTKRSIIENIIALDKNVARLEVTKDLEKNNKTENKILTKQYEQNETIIFEYSNKLEHSNKKLKEWEFQKKKEILDVENKISLLKNKKDSLDVADAIKKYEDAIKEIENLNKEIDDINKNKQININGVNAFKEKVLSIKQNKQNLIEEINPIKDNIALHKKQILENQKIIDSINNLEKGQKCIYCYGTIEEENFSHILNSSKNVIEKINQIIVDQNNILKEKQQLFMDLDKEETKLSNFIQLAEKKIDNYNKNINEHQLKSSKLSTVKMPDISVEYKLLEQQIIDHENLLNSKKQEILKNPFDEIIKDAQKSLDDKIKEKEKLENLIKNNTSELKYIEYWKYGFGDEGIRKNAIKKILPYLNNRIAYFLNILMDGKVQLTFDENLDETITRVPDDGDKFIFFAMSDGEKNKVNLAVSQAFSYIMNLKIGACPSFVFFDEIATNVDAASIPGVYKLIQEIAKDRQVFVVTHNQHLIELLQGHSEITLRKQNGISKLVL